MYLGTCTGPRFHRGDHLGTSNFFFSLASNIYCFSQNSGLITTSSSSQFSNVSTILKCPESHICHPLRKCSVSVHKVRWELRSEAVMPLSFCFSRAFPLSVPFL
ncbi:hypothetical protein FJTKL_04810 [Diaporthe vaccinii]|uniref:Uncharacterized protein n=1 Tax=Diaporthe vaccinii TaxID=105482 RepID=A0ABR4DSB6_9PEZI